MHSPRKTRGFTLVELLVVIGVTTILTAIVAPVLVTSTMEARTARCVGNLGQIARAVIAYQSSFGGQFPSPAHADTADGADDPLNDEQYWDGHRVGNKYLSYTWKGKLYSYIGGREDMAEDEVYKVMKCPAVRRFNGHKSFYGTNAYVTMHYGREDGTPEELVRFGRERALHFDQIEDHSNTFMFGENSTGHWAVRPESPRKPTDFTAATADAALAVRHDGRSAWVFFDGSVKVLTAPQAQARACALWFDLKWRASQ